MTNVSLPWNRNSHQKKQQISETWKIHKENEYISRRENEYIFRNAFRCLAVNLTDNS